MQIDYYFNGIKFRNHNVFVSGSNGIIGKPNRKKPNIFEFPGESGHEADLTNVRYEPREITLSCFIKATSASSLIDGYYNFKNILVDVQQTKTLLIEVGGKSLSYDVYLSDISDVNKKFTNGVNVGTFKIKFIEPDTSIYEEI